MVNDTAADICHISNTAHGVAYWRKKKPAASELFHSWARFPSCFFLYPRKAARTNTEVLLSATAFVAPVLDAETIIDCRTSTPHCSGNSNHFGFGVAGISFLLLWKVSLMGQF